MIIEGLEKVEFKSMDELNKLQEKELHILSSALWKYQQRVDAVINFNKELNKED